MPHSTAPFVGQRYRSGGMLAEVVEITPRGHVRLVRWGEHGKRPRRVPFELSRGFLGSETCGWKVVGEDALPSPRSRTAPGGVKAIAPPGPSAPAPSARGVE